MTKIDGDCRIRDIVRDSKIRKDFSSKLHQSSDLFLQGSNQASTELRHHRKFDVHHVRRDLPRFTVDEINRRFNHQSCRTEDSNKHWVRSKVPVLTVYATEKDLHQWIDAVDCFLEETQPPEKLECTLAHYALEGEAEQWWKNLQHQRMVRGESMITLWPRMKYLIFNDFWPTKCSTKCPLRVCNYRLGEECPFDDPSEFNISAETICTSTGIHRKQVMRGDFKPTNCLIKVPSENTVYDNEIVNGQQVGEVIRGANNIMAAENYEEENIDVDLEESSAEEQFELKLVACSSKGQWEPHISKEEKENDSEVLGAYMDMSTNISVDILDESLDVEHQDSVNGVPKSLVLVSQPDEYIKAFIKETKITLGAMHQTEPSTRDGHEKLELLSLAELCNMEMLGKVLTRKFDPGGIGQDRLLWFPWQDLLDGKHTLCYMNSIELESRPYVIIAQSKVVENKFCVLGNYELRNLSMPMLFGKFSKGSFEKSLYVISKMDVVRSCHEYVDFWYSSFLFLFDPGGEFRPARTQSIELMAEVMFNIPPIMCTSNVSYRMIAYVKATLNAVWEMVERAKEHQVIGNIQGSKIPYTVDKCIEERLEHLLVDDRRQLVGASVLLNLFQVLILSLLARCRVILAEMLLFMFDPGGDYRSIRILSCLVLENPLDNSCVDDTIGFKDCLNYMGFRTQKEYDLKLLNVLTCTLLVDMLFAVAHICSISKWKSNFGFACTTLAELKCHSKRRLVDYENRSMCVWELENHRYVKIICGCTDLVVSLALVRVTICLDHSLERLREVHDLLTARSFLPFDPGGIAYPLSMQDSTFPSCEIDESRDRVGYQSLGDKDEIGHTISVEFESRLFDPGLSAEPHKFGGHLCDVTVCMSLNDLKGTPDLKLCIAVNVWRPQEVSTALLEMMLASTILSTVQSRMFMPRSSLLHSLFVGFSVQIAHFRHFVNPESCCQSGNEMVGGITLHNGWLYHWYASFIFHILAKNDAFCMSFDDNKNSTCIGPTSVKCEKNVMRIGSSDVDPHVVKVLVFLSYSRGTRYLPLHLLQHKGELKLKSSSLMKNENQPGLRANCDVHDLFGGHLEECAQWIIGLNLTRGRVIPGKGWNDVNNSRMFSMARQSIVAKNGQTREHLELFYKVVNGLDPPRRYIVELGDFRCVRLLDVHGCACGQAF